MVSPVSKATRAKKAVEAKGLSPRLQTTIRGGPKDKKDHWKVVPPPPLHEPFWDRAGLINDVYSINSAIKYYYKGFLKKDGVPLKFIREMVSFRGERQPKFIGDKPVWDKLYGDVEVTLPSYSMVRAAYDLEKRGDLPGETLGNTARDWQLQIELGGTVPVDFLGSSVSSTMFNFAKALITQSVAVFMIPVNLTTRVVAGPPIQLDKKIHRGSFVGICVGLDATWDIDPQPPRQWHAFTTRAVVSVHDFHLATARLVFGSVAFDSGEERYWFEFKLRHLVSPIRVSLSRELRGTSGLKYGLYRGWLWFP